MPYNMSICILYTCPRRHTGDTSKMGVREVQGDGSIAKQYQKCYLTFHALLKTEKIRSIKII